jgi:hypothetical protein
MNLVQHAPNLLREKIKVVEVAGKRSACAFYVMNLSKESLCGVQDVATGGISSMPSNGLVAIMETSCENSAQQGVVIVAI